MQSVRSCGSQAGGWGQPWGRKRGSCPQQEQAGSGVAWPCAWLALSLGQPTSRNAQPVFFTQAIHFWPGLSGLQLDYSLCGHLRSPAAIWVGRKGWASPERTHSGAPGDAILGQKPDLGKAMALGWPGHVLSPPCPIPGPCGLKIVRNLDGGREVARDGARAKSGACASPSPILSLWVMVREHNSQWQGLILGQNSQEEREGRKETLAGLAHFSLGLSLSHTPLFLNLLL